VNACTIASRSQLAWVRVLVASFREHNPGPESQFTALLLDGVPGADSIEGARIRLLDELLDEAQCGLTVAGNPRGALEAAILPYLLERLLAEGTGPVAYLAPGLRVLGPLVELERALKDSEVVLVARARAGARQGEVFAGQNGGGSLSRRLLGVRKGESAAAVLAAWPRWFKDGESAVQTWFDGLPAVAREAAVLGEPGYGLDPWTLDGWQVSYSGEGELLLEPEGKPARVFDFTNLDPLHPDRLCDAEEAVRLSSVPALAELGRREAAELLEAGWAQDAARAERLEVLGDGTHMTPTLRKLLVQSVHEGELSQSPFSDAGRNTFFSYLNQPAQRGQAVGLTRLHQAIWEARVDLQAAYPHIDGPDGVGYAGWLCVHGYEESLSQPLLPTAPPHIHHDGAFDLHQREEPWGVNVAGFFTSELGLGEAARLLIAGLDACGVPALPVQAQLVPPCRQGAEFIYADPDAAAYPINIVCMNGDTIAPFAREVGGSFFRDRHTIALWWWEVGEFPAGWEAAFEYVDEVWVASRHIYDAIAPATPVPVVQVGMPVALPRVPSLSRSELSLPEEGFLFLFVHDYHSTAARKNPVGLVEAFKRAFRPGSGAKLVVKSINAENLPHEHDRVVLAAGEHPDITLLDAYVSAAEKNAMIAACDCYVSLHRSEGFGLTAAEAMLLGKPVIATRYGGTLEFMNDSNSYLVDWQPAEVGEDAHPYPAEGKWADPDLNQAAALMSEVFADPGKARARGELAKREMIERHCPKVAGESMRARLRTIHERRLRSGAKTLNLNYMPALEMYELPELIASEARVPSTERRARVKRVAHRVMARLLRPFLAHQRAVNSRLQDSVERLDARLHEVARTLQDQQEARFAQALALARRLRSDLGDARAELGGMRTELTDIMRTQLSPRLDALEGMGRELEQHLAEHHVRPYVDQEHDLKSWSEPALGAVLGFRPDGDAAGSDGSGVLQSNTERNREHRPAPYAERTYIDFEGTFRGPEERVRNIQRTYLPLLTRHTPVLDVGCGRGELLDLLAESGVQPASGVDMDTGMVKHARAKGPAVALGDGVAYLRTLEAESLGAVVALEVIEHLPYAQLLELLRLARSRLRDDGVLLLETVNPHAVHAMKAFWVDPTHQHPLFPEVMLELCRLTGFAQALWFHPTGSGDFESDRNHEPIYAVLARPT
jgi:glycosyltransferase involved in cell wall biosynthesis/2-polyprenyl-3-methyl-5-hydroxy-6-metoxy-1,4-benzoquinol methylase